MNENIISSYEEYENHKNDENCYVIGLTRIGCYKGLDFFGELNESEKLREFTNIEAFEDYLVFIKTHIIKLEEENKQLKTCYCNRTDCGGRIKDSKKFDSVQQRIDKAISLLCDADSCIMKREYSKANMCIHKAKEILRGKDE